MKAWLSQMTGTNLGLLGMILIGLFAVGSGTRIVMHSTDPEAIKAGVAAIAIGGSAVTLIGGFIGGYYVGKISSQNSSPSIPETPKVEG